MKSNAASGMEPPASRWKSVAWALLAASIPNVVLVIAGQWLFMQRAWVNLDYALVLVAGLALGMSSGYLLVAVLALFAVDIVFAFAPAYHFTPASLLDSLSGVTEIGFGIIAGYTAAILACAGAVAWVVAMTSRKITRRAPAALALGASILMVAVLDPMVSKTAIRTAGVSFITPNLGFSTAWNATVAARTQLSTEAQAPSARNVAAASDEIADRVNDESIRPPLVILINVESLGLFKSAAANEWLLAPLVALDDHPQWQVTTGEVPYQGSTVAGELRELCTIRYLTVSPRLDDQWTADCLIEQAENAGYHTAAFHGFQGTFFERNRWYRELGFDDVLFGHAMMATFSGLERCGTAFEGVCDRSAWRAIRQHANRAPRPTFLYWMTLTAHLPVLPHADLSHRKQCQAAPILAENAKLCDHTEWHRALFRRIARDLRRDWPERTTLVLVGDHSPPFVDQQSRSMYSQTHVPAVTIHKAAGNRPQHE